MDMKNSTKKKVGISIAIVFGTLVLGELEKIGTPEKILEDPVKTAKHVAAGSLLSFATWFLRRPHEIEEIEEDSEADE